MNEYDIDQKVNCIIPTEDGATKKVAGRVLAVKRYENEDPSVINTTSYVVAVGDGKKVGEREYNPRGDEIAKRMNDLIADGLTPEEVNAKIAKAKNLPKDEIITEPIFEYETVELTAENIEPAE